MHTYGAVVKNLPQVLEQIKKECASRGMHVLRGKLIGVESFQTGFPRVAWVAGEDGEWCEFLEFGQNLGVKAVVIDYEQLDMEILRDDAEAAMLDDEYSDTWTELKGMLDALEEHDGEIGHVGMMFQHGHMIYQASVKAPWFDDYALVQEMTRSFDEFMEDEGDMYDIQ